MIVQNIPYKYAGSIITTILNGKNISCNHFMSSQPKQKNDWQICIFDTNVPRKKEEINYKCLCHKAIKFSFVHYLLF